MKKLFGSLRMKLVLIICAVLIPVNILLIVAAQSIINNVWRTLISSYEHELELYMVQIDDDFENIEQELHNLMAQNWPDLNPASRNYEFARNTVWQILRNARQSHDRIDAAYLKTNWDSWTGITRDLTTITYSEEHVLQDFFQTTDLEAYHPYAFEIIDIEGEKYVVVNVNYYEYSFGFLVKVSELMNGLYSIQDGNNEQFYLADLEGNIVSADMELKVDLESNRQILEVNGKRDDYQVIHYASEIMDYEIIRLIPTDILGSAVPQMERLLLFFSIASLALIPIMLLAIRKIVLVPMHTLNQGMEQIEKENIGYRLPEGKYSTEFQYTNATFNRMVNQIHTLKIEAYEQDIEKLKMETTNLRLQINPHLLLNSLNMIYSLAQSRNYEVITQYTEKLMEYFRYSLRQNDELVKLSAEMDFVKHYLDIQRIRFPGAFTSTYEIGEGLDDVLIPPLIIENFVENSIKYALKMGETIEIIIVAASREDFITISVVDTGNGIKPEILEKLQRGEPVTNRVGSHIGILNCRRRLKVFYGDGSELSISSKEGVGTQIWMKFPIRFQ